jgi:hypothetical protein
MGKPLMTVGHFSWVAFLGGFLFAATLGIFGSLATAFIDADRKVHFLIAFVAPMLVGLIPGVMLIVIAARHRWTGYLAGGIAGTSVTLLVGCVAGVISMCASVVS